MSVQGFPAWHFTASAPKHGGMGREIYSVFGTKPVRGGAPDDQTRPEAEATRDPPRTYLQAS